MAYGTCISKHSELGISAAPLLPVYFALLLLLLLLMVV